MMPEFIEAFMTFEGHNVLFFAYGQTGTGKTHTMLGTDESLQSSSFHEGWGIFPRTVDQIFKSLETRASSGEIQYTLLASAVEFYLGAVFDLLGDHLPCDLDPLEKQPVGQIKIHLQNLADLMSFLRQVQQNRTTRSTRMNEAKGGHTGSSRSHCALILTLLQCDLVQGRVCETNFALVDLAGAERPDKTGQERVDGAKVVQDLLLGKELSIGAQGFIINHELFQLATEVVKATSAHKSRRAYSPPFSCCTAAVKFLGTFLDGSAMLGMVVTLSQAASSGWETWFSLQYGTDLSKLKAPWVARKSQALEKAAKSSAEELLKFKDLLAKTPPSGAPASKYYQYRMVMVRKLEQQNALLLELLQKSVDLKQKATG
eukprot:Skav233072  [mRNA]  locus=scaffold1468:219503:220621:- [translate_table: standard]